MSDSRLTGKRAKWFRMTIATIILGAWLFNIIPNKNSVLTITLVLAAAIVLFGDAVKQAHDMAVETTDEAEEIVDGENENQPTGVTTKEEDNTPDTSKE